MIDLLAQTTVGEGAALVGTGGAAATILYLLAKHGAKLVIGSDPEGKPGGNGKTRTSQVCPAHGEFSAKLDERYESQKESLSLIVRNQESQHKLLMAMVAEVRTNASEVKAIAADVTEMKGAIVRVHDRVDLAMNGAGQGNNHKSSNNGAHERP